jgi:hypothetical protein
MTVGENWVQRLLRRHPQLKTKYTRKYDYRRALCEDPEKISAWFTRVKKTVSDYGVLDDDIYNFDETGFQMGVASTSKVVTRSDRRNRPVVIQPGNREWTTVIECINASGWSVDPMIIFEGKVHIASWYDGSVLPKTWRVGVSDNGWTTDELTFEWLREVFEPQTRNRTVGRYRLLILDGHGSHLTPAFDKFCTDHRILTECMPPHSSHYLQPLDVSCFAVLKRTYGDLVKAMIALGVITSTSRDSWNCFSKPGKRLSAQRTSQVALELQDSCLSIQLRSFVGYKPRYGHRVLPLPLSNHRVCLSKRQSI